MPSLYEALHSAIHSSSGTPRKSNSSSLMVGMVASPTPILPMLADSISVMLTLKFNALLRYAAAIHPELPPPTMMRLRTRPSLSSGIWFVFMGFERRNSVDGPGSPVCRGVHGHPEEMRDVRKT